ncbi:MAG TPA: P-loop NTPase, partial [Candidatus Bathyarchaeia archaeon]|nr:P-loop NTPase [Candidatus Bathyarchaeia archaeon]
MIAFHSYKGGTGKTSIALNVAYELSKKGKSGCLIELDFRAPSLPFVIGIAKPNNWMNDYLNGVCGIDKVLIDLSEKYKLCGKFFVALANYSTEATRDMSSKDRKWEMRSLGRLL